MAQFSPELIKKTISVFEKRSDSKISKEKARQALENISGFFQVLQEWAEAEDRGNCEDSPTSPKLDAGVAQ